MELLWGEAFFAGALAQLVARLTSLPAVVLLLATGLFVGRAGLDLVQPETLGRGLEPLVGLLVSLVLFDGGLNLRLAGRDLQRAVVQLVLVRGVLGLVGGALFALLGRFALALGLGVWGDCPGHWPHGGHADGAADASDSRLGAAAGSGRPDP